MADDLLIMQKKSPGVSFPGLYHVVVCEVSVLHILKTAPDREMKGV